VPCRAAFEEQLREEDDEEDEEEIPRKNGEYPTMIFCNPNAGYAEYF